MKSKPDYMQRATTGKCKICGRNYTTLYDSKTCQICDAESRGGFAAQVPPLPKPIEHLTPLPLKTVGGRCPYCKGTTGFHGTYKVVFCYSCDYTWNYQGQPIGVKLNIGLF